MKYIIIILILSSCSTASLMNRYVKRGGTFEPIEKIVTITDTLQGADGRDSIVFRDIEVPCPDPVIETKWQTRIKYKFDSKRFKDSLKSTKRMYSDSLKSAVKTHRIESSVEKNKDKQQTKQVKAKYNIWLILISLVCGYALPKIAQKIWKKF